jgi:hypothetical protein
VYLLPTANSKLTETIGVTGVSAEIAFRFESIVEEHILISVELGTFCLLVILGSQLCRQSSCPKLLNRVIL